MNGTWVPSLAYLPTSLGTYDTLSSLRTVMYSNLIKGSFRCLVRLQGRFTFSSTAPKVVCQAPVVGITDIEVFISHTT